MRDVIAHERIAAFEQTEHTFAFPDATGATDDHPDTLNVHHAAVFALARCEIELQRECGGIDETHRHHRRAEHRYLAIPRRNDERFRHAMMPRHHDARNGMLTHRLAALLHFLVRQTFQIRKLRRAQNLDALVREIRKETTQRQAGPVDRGLADSSLESNARLREWFELQRLRVSCVELAHGQCRVLFRRSHRPLLAQTPHTVARWKPHYFRASGVAVISTRLPSRSTMTFTGWPIFTASSA